MPLTPQQKLARLQELGFNPNEAEYGDDGIVYKKEVPVEQPTVPATDALPESSASGSFYRGAKSSILPTAGGLGAAALASYGLGSLGLATGPFAPIAVPLLAGIGGSVAASALQEKIAPTTPQEMLQKQADITRHPVASFAGEVGPGLLAFKPSMNLPNAVKDIYKATVPGTGRALTALEKANLLNVGLGAATPVLTEGVLPAIQGQDVDGKRLAASIALGAVANEPTRLAQRMFGFHPTAEARRAPQMGDEETRALAQQMATADEAIAQQQATNSNLLPGETPQQAAQRYMEQRSANQRKSVSGYSAVDYANVPVEQTAVQKPASPGLLESIRRPSINAPQYPEQGLIQEMQQRNAAQASEISKQLVAEQQKSLTLQQQELENLRAQNAAKEVELQPKLVEPKLTDADKAGIQNEIDETQFSTEKPLPESEHEDVNTLRKQLVDEFDKTRESVGLSSNPLNRAFGHRLGEHRGGLIREVSNIQDNPAAQGAQYKGTRDIDVSVPTGRADTAPHEVFHLMSEDVLKNGSASEKQFLQDAESAMPQDTSRGAHEELTRRVGYEAARRAKKGESVSDTIKDTQAWLRIKRGAGSREDYVRLASAKLLHDPHYMEGLGFKAQLHGSAPSYIGEMGREIDMPTKMYNLEEDIKDGSGRILHGKGSTVSEDTLRKYGVNYSEEEPLRQPSHTGSFKANAPDLARAQRIQGRGEMLLNTLKNRLTPVEYDMYEKAGLQEYAKSGHKTTDDLVKWLDENAPKVEVHSYGQEGKVSKAKQEYDKMTHEWFDNLSRDAKDDYLDAFHGGFVHTDTAKEQLKTSNWDSFDVEKAVKYKELQDRVRTEGNGYLGPRATSAYNHVSPKDTKKYPVQRVDVVLPRNKVNPDTLRHLSEAEQENLSLTKTESMEPVKWQPDNLHENLPNTLGWAAIQYEPHPTIEGAKVAHIFEAQSRWGQQMREAAQGAKRFEASDSPSYSDTNDAVKYRDQNHPLLKDYNRLILKAAIEQARKEGATHIAISDAETAMMSEGHDAHADQLWRNPKTGEETRASVGAGETGTLAQQGWIKVGEPSAPQDSGMRLNYDKILPSIAEELTGAKGERVSFGEHKNAIMHGAPRYETRNGRETWVADDAVKPRDNLIFKNPDGTPKADVSARVYPIAENIPQREPYLFGKRYSVEEPLTKEERNRFIERSKTISKEKSIPGIRSGIEELRSSATREDRYIADTFTKNREARDKLIGDWKNKLHGKDSPLEKLSKAEMLSLNDTLVEMDNSHKEPVYKNEKEREAGEFVRGILKDIGQKRLDWRVPVWQYDDKGRPTPRELKMDKYYYQNVMSGEVRQELIDNPASDRSKQLKADFLAHLQSKGATEETAKEVLDSITSSSGKPSDGEFNAVRVQEGYGLPKSWIEPNVLKAMDRYTARVANDLAYHNAIQVDPIARRILGIKEDPWGRKGVNASKWEDSGEEILSRGNNPLVQDLQKINKGEYTQNEALFRAATQVAKAAMIGPLSKVKDITSVTPLMAQYAQPEQIPGMIAHGFKNRARGSATAIEQGLTHKGVSSLENLTERTGGVVERLQNAAKFINKIQGAEQAEEFARGLAVSQAEFLTVDNIQRAQHGTGINAEHAKKWLSEFSNGEVSGDYSKVTEAQIKEISTRVAAKVQSTYDYRDLPSWMLSTGYLPALFTLSKWGISQTNNFVKNLQTRPLQTLLTGFLGAAVGGELNKELSELINDKKSSVPGWKEIAEGSAPIETKMGLNTYALTAALQYSGYAGILSDYLKMAQDVAWKNRANPAAAPTTEALNDVAGNISQALSAINDGEAAGPVLAELSGNLARNNVQALRLVMNQLGDKTEKERKANQRNLRAFEMTSGKYPYDDYGAGFGNPYEGLSSREFKNTRDIGEASNLAQSLVSDKTQELAQNPEQLQAELKGLRNIGIRYMPSPERSPLKFFEYMDYVRRTYGEDKAASLINEFYEQRNLNEVKKGMIPSI